MSLKDIFRKHAAAYFILSILTLLALYVETVSKVFKLWQDDGYSHGYLLLLIALYLIYKQLQEVNFNLVFSPSLAGIIVLVGISCVWFVARVILVLKIEQISLFLILASFIWAYLGFHQARRFFFPVLLLLLSVPVVELFNVVFQKATAILTGVALGVTGIPAVVEGLLILVPAGTFVVDTSCSGIRVVNVGVVLALLYVYTHRLRTLDSVIFVVLTAGVSFLCNIIRVYIIVIVGNMTNMQHSLVGDHGDLGWFVFAIVISIYLFIVHRYWPHRTREDDMRKSQKLTAVSGVNKNYGLALGIALGLAGGGIPLSYYYLQSKTGMTSINEFSMPALMDGWRRIDTETINWKPSYTAGKGDVVIHKGYRNDLNEKVYVYLSLFTQQTESNETINVNNRVYDRPAWSKVSSNYISVSIAPDRFADVEEIMIRAGQNREMLVWRGYVINNKVTGNPYYAKLFNLQGVLQGKSSMLVYIVATDVTASSDAARMVLKNFWESSLTDVLDIQ